MKFGYVFLVFLSFGFFISCKTDTRFGTDSGVSSLVVNTPDKLKGVVQSVKVVARSDNQEDSVCDQVIYPIGANDDFEDQSSYAVVMDESSKIGMRFLNKCFPYKVSMAYMCPTKKEGESKSVLCYKGEASAELKEVVDNTLVLRIKLTGQNGYEKNPVSTDKVIEDFISADCAKSLKKVYKYGSSDQFGLLLDPEVCPIKNIEQNDLEGFSKTISSDPSKTSINYSITEQGFSEVITSIKVVKGSFTLDADLSDTSSFLTEPVTKTLKISYCKLIDYYIMGDAECKNFKTIVWTAK